MFPKKLRNVYHFGDAFEQMKQIPDQSVNLVFTSCPDLSQMESKDFKEKEFYRNAVNEMCRIVKDDGFLILSQTDRKINGRILPKHIWFYQFAIKNGLHLKDTKVVIRNHGSKGKFPSVEEAVGKRNLYRLMFQQLQVFTRNGTFKYKGDTLRSILVDNQNMVENQPVWSQEFCKLIVSSYSKEGAIVVDPFAGVGPVLLAAKNLKRIYFGCEIAKKYYNKNFTKFELS